MDAAFGRFAAVLLAFVAAAAMAEGHASIPDTVVVHDGPVALKGLLWYPEGHGPLPAILLNHGSGRTPEELKRLGAYEQQAETLGPVFARHGYVFLFLFRRGVGLSTGLGENAVDLMNKELDAHGEEARNTLQLQLLEGRKMNKPVASVLDGTVIGAAPLCRFPFGLRANLIDSFSLARALRHESRGMP